MAGGSKAEELQRRLGLLLQAAEAAPRNAAVHTEIGHLFRQLGKPVKALRAYRQGHALAPQSVDAAWPLIDLLSHGEGDAEIEAVARAAGVDESGHPAALAAYADALVRARRYDEALKLYDRALAAKPEFALALDHRGVLLQRLGRMQEAEAAHREAARIAPRLAGAYFNLAMIAPASITADEIARLEALRAEPAVTGLPDSRAVQVRFALGTIYDRQKRYDDAFAAFAEANAMVQANLQRRGRTYDPARQAAEVDEQIARFDGGFFATRGAGGSPSDRPIFILGMPRSGTTLVEQILSAHSQVVAGDELKLAARLLHGLPGRLGRAGPPLAQIGDLTPEQRTALGEEYLRDLAGVDAGARHVTDKMPGNSWLVPFLALILPRARVIVCRRDAADTCLSNFFTYFAEGNEASAALASIGHQYAQHDRLMKHWLALRPMPMLDLRYEDLVGNFEAELRRLLEFCGLDFEPACLEFSANRRAVSTASVMQVRQGLYKGSVQRWRYYERHLGPLFAALGSSAPP